jgi:short chain dehydrogenase
MTVLVGGEMSDTFSVSDKVVVITGAGQGIGRSFAKTFASRGARVVIAERNMDKARTVRDEIAAGNGHAIVIETDVADESSVKRLGASVDQAFGRADVLINNAAIFSTLEMRPFDQIPLAEWEQVLRVNLTGPFLCARAMLPLMRKNKWGRIGRGYARPAELSALHRLEGGARRHDPFDGAGARSRWHHRQCGAARRHLYGNSAQDRHTRAERAHHRHAEHPAPAGARRSDRCGDVPCLRRVGVHDRAGTDRRRRRHPPLTGC